jgi:hypothetical protein
MGSTRQAPIRSAELSIAFIGRDLSKLLINLALGPVEVQSDPRINYSRAAG